MNLAAQPQLPDPETLRQLPNEQLVSIIMQQQQVIGQQQSHRGIDPGSQPT